MPTPYETSLAAISISGTGLSEDLSGNAGVVKQSSRAAIELAAPITPAQSTIATWVMFKNYPRKSLATIWFGGAPETAFANGLWVYVSGYPNAATSITYRYNSLTATGNLPATTDFDDWQHLLFTNDNGTVTGYLNAVPFSFSASVPNPQFQAVGGDTEPVRNSGSIFAGTALWDSLLPAADRSWLADPVNRPEISAGGGNTIFLIED